MRVLISCLQAGAHDEQNQMQDSGTAPLDLSPTHEKAQPHCPLQITEPEPIAGLTDSAISNHTPCIAQPSWVTPRVPNPGSILEALPPREHQPGPASCTSSGIILVVCVWKGQICEIWVMVTSSVPVELWQVFAVAIVDITHFKILKLHAPTL